MQIASFFRVFVGLSLFAMAVSVSSLASAGEAQKPGFGKEREGGFVVPSLQSPPLRPVPIGYIREMVERPLPASRLDVEPKDVGVAGAKMAIEENNAGGRFLGDFYSLDVGAVASPEEAVEAMQTLYDSGHRYFVVDASAATLLKLADEYLERDGKGHYGQTLAANPSMYCLDFGDRRSVAEVATAAEALKAKYPPLGDSIGWGALSCTQWPVPAVLKPQKLTAEGAAPILVLGTVDDPATPYEWAQGLASQLSSGRLLTWDGHQHTAYNQGSDCIDSAVEAYLLAGTLPPEGKRCS